MEAEKRKKLVYQSMMGIRHQIFRAIIFDTHAGLLQNDKDYFKSYCKKLGIPERKMRMIMNGTYDGTVPDLIALAQRCGSGCVFKFNAINNKKNAAKKETKTN